MRHLFCQDFGLAMADNGGSKHNVLSNATSCCGTEFEPVRKFMFVNTTHQLGGYSVKPLG